MLPDVLAPNLLVVICGTAVENHSATTGLYYAGRGNRFWPPLYTVGLIPHSLKPEQYQELLTYKTGLADLVKCTAGMDNALKSTDFDIVGFENKILRYKPKVVCFNGKKAAQVYLSRTKVEYGFLPEKVGETLLYVAPSTSGAAIAHWDEGLWRKLVEFVTRT